MNTACLFSPRPSTAAAVTALLIATFAAQAADPAACQVKSGARAAPVVELYTSEGCSSCPPADRWLSKAESDPETVALAFHVDYWDRLGWTDRHASAAYTRRQQETQRTSGARFSYTPQVLVDGRDRPAWPELPLPLSTTPRGPSLVDVALVREGAGYRAAVTPAAGAPVRLEAYWAVTENGHVSQVRAGENLGRTLSHDDVVREYRPVPAWAGRAGAAERLAFDPATAADPAHPREIKLVVVDAATGRPVQAVRLGC